MSVAIKKLEGVETVEVSLEKASAVITFKADNKITLAQLRRIIRSIGYPTKEAQIVARGSVIDRNGKPALDLLNGSFLDLEEKPESTSGVVELRGVSLADPQNVEHVKVTAVK